MKMQQLLGMSGVACCLLAAGHAGAGSVIIVDVGDILTANYLGAKVLRTNPQTGAQQSLGSFAGPTDLALTAAGSLYVSELGGAIKRLTLTNSALALVGPASLTSVRGLVLDPASGDLFVTGRSNTVDVVMRVNPTTRQGTIISRGGNLSLPTGIEILNADHLVVACFTGSSIVKIRISDGFQTVIASGGTLLDRPWGLGVSGDLIYAAHFDSKHINKISASTGAYSLLALAPGIPYGMGVDANGNVLVGAVGNVGQQDMLARFTPQGVSLGTINVGLRQQVSGIEVSRIRVVGNRPPVPASPFVSWPVSCGLKIRVEDLVGSDPEGDTLVVSSVDPSSSEGGTVSLLEGWVGYTPPVGGLTTTDSFGYTVSDGNGNHSAGVVTIFPEPDYTASLNLSWDLASGGGVQIIGSGIPQRVYTVEYTENLDWGDWLPLGNVTADASGIFEYTDTPPAGSSARFYRTWTSCP